MVNVVIEPYEPLIAKAIELIQQKEPGYFQGISKVVVEPSDQGHFGRVESDKPDTIFISISRLRNALSGDEDSQVLEAALTLAHEMGHLKSEFTGGEAPAEAEENRMKQILTSARLRNRSLAVRYARKNNLFLVATPYPSSIDLSRSILSVVRNFSEKGSPESKQKYLQALRGKLIGLDAVELASKPKNPSGGLGASISTIKNLLSGHPEEVVRQTVTYVIQGLSSL